MNGVHTGWAVIEADNEVEARLAVPPLVRGQARIVKVTKFDAAMLLRYTRDDGPCNPAALPIRFRWRRGWQRPR